MIDGESIVAALCEALEKTGFMVQREVTLLNTRYDLVAENENKLLFAEVHTSNANWLDSFYERQAALVSALAKLDLGRKWRDVYLVEITTDPVDSESELSIVNEIQSNTMAARKLVIDASQFGTTNSEEIASKLLSFLNAPKLDRQKDQPDIRQELITYLAAQGHSRQLIETLVGHMDGRGKDCVDTLMAAEDAN